MIRPGTPTEAAEVWRADRAAEGRRPSAAQLAEATEALGRGLLVVLEEDGRVLGCAAGELGGEVLALRALVVHPAARLQGHGAALADALADRAYPLGARRVTAPEGPAGFWEACGLEPSPGGWAGELEPPQRDLPVSAEGLRLGQLLKLAGLVDTGSQAKSLLTDGEVLVNGEVELRRGRQVATGDVVQARGVAIRVVPPG